jgi:hypothetical protein
MPGPQVYPQPVSPSLRAALERAAHAPTRKGRALLEVSRHGVDASVGWKLRPNLTLSAVGAKVKGRPWDIGARAEIVW